MPDGTARAETFQSLLYPRTAAASAHALTPAGASLHDLGLDAILDAAASSSAARAVLSAPLRDPAAIRYRQEVMRDLESAELRDAVTSFRADLRAAAVRLDEEADAGFPYARERAVLDAAVRYVRAVAGLSEALQAARLTSRGLARLRDRLMSIVAGDDFTSLARDSKRAWDGLSALHYSLRIEGRSVTVGPTPASHELHDDLSRQFGRFMQDPPPEPQPRAYLPAGRSAVQAQILRRLAALHPEPFEALRDFAGHHHDVIDPLVARVDGELDFYLDYLRTIAPLRAAGLPFCYPTVGPREAGCLCLDTFDLALALRLVAGGSPIVPNDIELRGGERMLVVTGPNQGGKTTLARTFGQLHYLAALGCPVPGREVRLAPFDGLLTHFQRGERAGDLRGRLVDELTRLRELLEAATPDSIVVLNEPFASTTLADARFLGRKLLARLSQLDLRAVIVTFVDGLSTFDAKTVSMVSMVDAEDPAIRTLKVLRRPADGAAHALAIARKHGVTLEQILERLSP